MRKIPTKFVRWFWKRLVIEPRFRADRTRMLFVVGHMRSGSSLLVHILATNPEIIGFGETHSHYRGDGATGAVAYKVYRSFNRFLPRERYIVDKILHDYLEFSARDADAHQHRTILLARRPQEALPSILGLPDRDWSEHAAVDHYARQLERIEQLGTEVSPRRWLFLTYDDLVHKPGPTLKRLSSFLELSTPLTPEYDLMWSTGQLGIGDHSDDIRAGRITRPKRCYPHQISDAALRYARYIFERVTKTLRDRDTTTLPGATPV